ncbi:superinfection exclusion B family protein [Bacillus sp. SCS-151]|uniref:superinfection exclusion B family protein n=1 Tax=Nanhaiella sioensis TaxID=3115293 RepID=UPI0039785093
MKFDFNIKEILTLPVLIWAALSLASSMLLFSPTSFLKQLFMLEFRDKFGFIIGIVFVVSISILIVNLIYKTLKSIGHARTRKKFYAYAEDRLRKLTDYQKAIIYALYQEDNHTLKLPFNDGGVSVLVQNKMIGMTANNIMIDDDLNPVVSYLLQPWVGNELTDKPSLLSEFSLAFKRQHNKKYSNFRY